MLSTAEFLTASQWVGIFTLVCATLAGLGFVLQWGIRFRLVGVTGFMGVLTGGLFALGLVPFTHPAIPGAVHFSVVFDNGANQVVIVVPPTITAPELEATLQQAAGDLLYSYSRLSPTGQTILLRARTILHPQPGVSQPVYLGQVRRVLGAATDDANQIQIFADQFALLPKPAASPAT
ncbi:hypothetical protein DO97_05010 [Neosynechococcus sphagnicola sy1]|uniref:DUF2518 family protein n=1 Tax=Neosynechococcus sphagnicola sy1 TaxID=1497020 RepID=A0A098TKB3_9CYAN|nr:Ycf51 family protein [Neosynechococcus sphagnicola]KGF72721.1 hypothetical protein DO97_05010 [Neosynechococcus sphagnicola sy1]